MGVGNDVIVKASQGKDESAARQALLSMLDAEPPRDLPPFQKLMINEARTEAVGLLIAHRVADVVPVLRRWARSIASDIGPVDPRTVELVQTGLVSFQADEALPELRAMLSSANPQVHQAAVSSIAALDIPEALDIQEQIVRDEGANPSLRCQAATALVRAEKDAGRALLLESYRRYNESEGVTKRNVETLTATMRLNGKTTDELKQLAADNDWSRAHETRYAAISELTRRGGSEMIPFLEQLKPWTNPSGVEPVCGLVEGQKQVMQDEIVAPAIATLRLRAEREAARRLKNNAP